jgi:hypothetical protein
MQELQMNRFIKLSWTMLFSCIVATGSPEAVVEATQVAKDNKLQTDPASGFWNGASPIHFELDKYGKPIPNRKVEVRARWTTDNLYFLFICPYQQQYLKPAPVSIKKETNELWKWDVAEVFIGSDFRDIKRYREFEVSPRGEWVDLDIDLNKSHHEDGWKWNSGFEVAARIDPQNHLWYAAMRIPWSAIDTRPVVEGNTLRMNLFLSQGPPSAHEEITWQPPMSDSFHAPEHFGSLKLVGPH